uniref:Uncharacterized protein n=1 Tax=viral metagenome TaxID=1070528 RepID=A0A6M3KAR1_9ZZZZ
MEKVTKKDCPYYQAPRYYVNPETDEVVEGSAMCELVDKYCLKHYGQKCGIYDEEMDKQCR